MQETAALDINTYAPRETQTPTYKERPDYETQPLNIPESRRQSILEKLAFLYGEESARQQMPELERLLKVHHAHKSAGLLNREASHQPRERFTQDDIVLITYGDLLRGLKENAPLKTLADLMSQTSIIRRVFNTIHILPFFPYSSDRGFSVTNFRAVDPQLGSWQDIGELNNHFQLMFDGVFNHASSHSPAFQKFLDGDPDFADAFISYNSPDELTPEQRSKIIRPRTSDILTKFQTIDGPKWVWTTFSPDQIDLNFHSPMVLLWIIETLLFYVRNGADIIRLDAVTYIWSEPGSSSANLEQAHMIVKIFREILDLVAPGVALITETNVPHSDNVAYFGSGDDEAQMVYNFALPPLVLHSFYRENTAELSKWAANLQYPSETTTFFNILDTHDGIGLQGVKNILPQKEIDFIIRSARENGAFISYKQSRSGCKEPYEINSTWFSALNRDDDGEDNAFKVKRLIASRSIALALRGVPGIYLHGLLGTRNDTETVLETKSKRDINRKPIDVKRLAKRIKEPDSRLYNIAHDLPKLTDIRRQQRAFHPGGDQKVIRLAPEIFALLRTAPEGDQHILALTNVANRCVELKIPLSELGIIERNWFDLVAEKLWHANDQHLELTMAPYDVAWLMPFSELERCIED